MRGDIMAAISPLSIMRVECCVGPAFQAHAGGHFEIDAIFPARMLLARLHPVNLARRDAVLMLKHAAQPHRRGHRVFRHAHAFPAQIFDPLNAGIGIDENTAMTKRPRRKHRNGNKRPPAA